MALHPTSSKRTRAFNVFVGFFFIAVWTVMLASGVVARDANWTWEEMLEALRSMLIIFVTGLPTAYVYIRKGGRNG